MKMIKEIVFDLKDYDERGSVFQRKAVRGIVKKGEKYLIIHGKYGDHKFPGGGMDEGESLLDTLFREVLEETGYQVKEESVSDYILVHERRKGMFNDCLDMDSWYYFCEVGEEVGERNLDEYEKEYEYEVEWMDLDEVLRKNEEVKDRRMIPWIDREILVMREILGM